MTRLSRIAQSLEWISNRLARILSVVAAVAVAAIVVILGWSSIQRYVLVHPIPAAEELASFLFVAVAFLAIMEAMVTGRQIRVLPLWLRLPPRLQAWAMVAGHALSIGVLGILIKQTASFALSSYEYGARSYVANLPEWPWMMIIPVALAALAFALFARLLTDVVRALRGEPLPEATTGDAGELV
jgi:TRAP-type C4-dicarboxylate transport system permease small subunit